MVPKRTILSAAPIAGNITVVNKVATLADTVTVTGLVAGDEVKVYTASTGGTVLTGTSGIVAGGATSVTITLTANLGTSAGSTWVTVTNAGKEESTPRVNVAYSAEDYSSGFAQFIIQRGENSMLKQVGVIIPAN